MTPQDPLAPLAAAGEARGGEEAVGGPRAGRPAGEEYNP